MYKNPRNQKNKKVTTKPIKTIFCEGERFPVKEPWEYKCTEEYSDCYEHVFTKQNGSIREFRLTAYLNWTPKGVFHAI